MTQYIFITDQWSTFTAGWTSSTDSKIVGDVNGDGKADAIAYGNDGIHVALSTGSSFGPSSRWSTFTAGWTSSTDSKVVGDVDGDGKADAIAYGNDGIHVALSTGSSFRPSSRWSTFTAGWTSLTDSKVVGDVDGDGKADAIAYGNDGIHVALSTGSSFGPSSRWSTFTAGWTSSTDSKVVGDVDGDGKADVIAYGNDGIHVGLTTTIVTLNPTTNPFIGSTASVSINENCLKLKSLHLGSVGDLDRNNEEIEIYVKSGIQELDCGLYLFDISENTQDIELNIPISCIKDEFVKVRFYERDNCNDDMRLENIRCEITNEVQTLEVIISPDGTETSYTTCLSSSNTVGGCVDASGGTVVQVGGAFCADYTWGEEECGSITVFETNSQYYLEYEITQGICTDGSTVNNCIIGEQYYPGPICDTNNADSFLQIIGEVSYTTLIILLAYV